MNRQELWEDCFKNLVYFEVSNSSHGNDPIKEIIAWSEHAATLMVERIMCYRNEENNKAKG